MTTATSGAPAMFGPDSALARAPEIARESAVFREVLTEIGRVIVGQHTLLEVGRIGTGDKGERLHFEVMAGTTDIHEGGIHAVPRSA